MKSLNIHADDLNAADIQRGIEAATAVFTEAGEYVPHLYDIILEVSHTPMNRGFLKLATMYADELALWNKAESAAINAAYNGQVPEDCFAVLTYE
jgi:hypothetical protein